MMQGIQSVGVQASYFQGTTGTTGANFQAASSQGVNGSGFQGVEGASFQSSFQATGVRSNQDVFLAALIGLLLGKSEEKQNDPLLALLMMGLMQPMQMQSSYAFSEVSMAYQSSGGAAAAAPTSGAGFSATA